MQEYVITKKAIFVLALIGIITVASTYFILTQTSTKVTGLAAGTATVSVNPTVTMSLQQATVDFGDLVRSGVNNTTDEKPQPFKVRNDGNVLLNVSVRASSFIFSGSGAGNNTNKFQFMSGNVSGESNAFSWGNSITSFTNFTDVNQNTVATLNFSDTSDEAEVEIQIRVPSDEALGNKSADVIFTASQSS
ncbi:TPA: hypothetical protein H1005_02470 [archaeon]|nr:hypothetical protein [Candidatus Naiadarchaeales archaeon SRR2090153.bin1042]